LHFAERSTEVKFIKCFKGLIQHGIRPMGLEDFRC
jgi:hypothetical protein